MILGLTGGSGCGTSTVGKLLTQRGFLFIDADKLYHEMLSRDAQLRNRLVEAFGPTVQTREGLIDRRALGKIVFNDPAALERLNGITHPLVKAEILSQLQANAGKDIAIEAIALIESGIGDLCDCVIAVLADRETRICRIMIRDAVGHVAAQARIDAQPDNAVFAEKCHYTVYNNGTQEELAEQLDALLAQIRQ